MPPLYKINHAAALADWLEEPHKFGHLLGYDKLTPTHGKWIKIFFTYRRFDVLQAHRKGYKSTCGIVAMILLFLCTPNMRLLIVRKNMQLASDVLKTIQRHFQVSDVLRLYIFSRWNITNVETNVWSSERTLFSFKKSITPEPSLMAAGVGASITGAHFDFIWADDIVTIVDRYSPAVREWAKAYFRELKNLIENLGQIKLSGTPWHEEDVFSTLDSRLFVDRKFPFGTVDLPPAELAIIAEDKNAIPYAEWCCNYELRHVQDNDTIGAFPIVETWTAQYCVAFVDPSFSDKTDTDATAVSIVGVLPKGDLVFTGMKFPKSISHDATRRDILDFLQKFLPIETVLESQLADSSVFFVNAFRADEKDRPIKNLWTVKHQSRNKHERIAATVIANKPNMFILQGTQAEYSVGVSRYYKGAAHDDECFIASTMIATAYGKKQISNIAAGDVVITPFGLRKVLVSKCTGKKEVITKAGLTATKRHKIYNARENRFTPIDSLTSANECDRLTYRGLLRWCVKNQLYSTEKNTKNRETIISLTRRQTISGGIVSSCIKLFGSSIIKGRFLKAMLFIIKILTLITMTSAILSFYHAQNIARYIAGKITAIRSLKLDKTNSWIESDTKQKFGTRAQKGKNGTENTLRNHSQKRGIFEKIECVRSAAGRTLQKLTVKSIVLRYVQGIRGHGKTKNVLRLCVARVITYQRTLKSATEKELNIINTQENYTTKEKVYNLTVEGGVYYANGILVSNCDSLAGAIEHLGTSKIITEYAKAVRMIKR